MYAIRSYYGADTVGVGNGDGAVVGEVEHQPGGEGVLPVGLGDVLGGEPRLDGVVTVVHVGGRITSYNVCYTKLLRAADGGEMGRQVEGFEGCEQRVDVEEPLEGQFLDATRHLGEQHLAVSVEKRLGVRDRSYNFV